MHTLSAFMSNYVDCVFWHRVVGPREGDVFAYPDVSDMRSDTDRSRALARATVRLDITRHPDLYDSFDWN